MVTIHRLFGHGGGEGGEAVDDADIAPGFFVVEAVEGVAAGDAGLAAGAGIEIDLEGVLLAGRGRAERDQPAEALGAPGGGLEIVRGRGAGHRRLELLLVGEKLGEEGVEGRRRSVGCRLDTGAPSGRKLAGGDHGGIFG